MPVHSIPRAYLSERVSEIEAHGEIIVQVVPDGATVLVVTEVARVCAGELETR